MKRKHYDTRRGAAWLLAAVLLCGLLLVQLPAGASEIPADAKRKVQLTVNKTLETDVKSVWPTLPDNSLKFVLMAEGYRDGPAEVGTLYTDYNKTDMPMPTGSAAAVAPNGRTKELVASGFDTTTVGLSQMKATAATAGEIEYTQRGVYTYSLVEKPLDPAIPGLTQDASKYYFNVYVQNVVDSTGAVVIDGTTQKPKVTVTHVTIYKDTNVLLENESTDQPTPEGTNNGKVEVEEPGTNPGGAGIFLSTLDLKNRYEGLGMTVSKKVTGGGADITKSFAFTMALQKPGTTTADPAIYEYLVYDMGADGVVGGTDDTLVSNVTPPNRVPTGAGGTTTINLKHNQYFKVFGLPDKEKVMITETGAPDAAGIAGYKTSIASQHGGVPGGVTDVETNRTVNWQIVTGDENYQNFTNKKDTVTPTGLWLDILPYALIVLLIGGGGALYLASRKRHRREADGEDGLS